MMPSGWGKVVAAVVAEDLEVLGGVHRAEHGAIIDTLAFIGPGGPGFWPRFTASPEYRDGEPDPLDRWSARVISRLADRLGGRAIFPFGNSPPLPFTTWALKSGMFWKSPVGLLVHARQGLFVSFRGAIVLPGKVAIPRAASNPCLSCERKPCLTACPAAALTGDGYDLDACHAWLSSPDGSGCMGHGCAVRDACPVSYRYGRNRAQSAFHMKAFHP